MSDIQSASATQLVRNLQDVKDMLDNGPVAITNHGRTEFVLLSKDEYDHLNTLIDTDADRLDAKLRLVLGTIQAMVIITDPELNIRRVNRSYCNFMDVMEDDLIGRNLLDTGQSPVDKFVALRARAVMASGQEDSFELVSSHRPDRLLAFTVRPWPKGVAVFAHDITEKGANADRIMRDVALDEAVDAVGGSGLGVIDRTGRIHSAFRSLAAMVGSTQSSLEGVSLFTLLDAQSRGKIDSYISDFPETAVRLSIRYLRDGKEFADAQCAMTAYTGVKGQTLFAFALMDPERCGSLVRKAEQQPAG